MAACSHDVWYQNAKSLNARIALARSIGISVGFWHFGEEDPAIWKLQNIH